METFNQFFRLRGIVFHANAPATFFWADDPDVLEKSFGALHGRAVSSRTALGGRIVLSQVLGIFIFAANPGRREQCVLAPGLISVALSGNAVTMMFAELSAVVSTDAFNPKFARHVNYQGAKPSNIEIFGF